MIRCQFQEGDVAGNLARSGHHQHVAIPQQCGRPVFHPELLAGAINRKTRTTVPRKVGTEDGGVLSSSSLENRPTRWCGAWTQHGGAHLVIARIKLVRRVSQAIPITREKCTREGTPNV